tara:strand:+ start:554 stop:739 length:186 start_codon:yes stop_codon:yes gene_type:complete
VGILIENKKKEVGMATKWIKYYIYKDGKKIDTCTKKQINETWLKWHDLKWICKEKRTLEVA